MRKIITIIQHHFLLKLFPVWTLRHMGMEIGDNCYIDRHIFIPSEPYLIKVGNNVGITSGVHLHTHGGARAVRQSARLRRFRKNHNRRSRLYRKRSANNAVSDHWRRQFGCSWSHCDKIRPETHGRRRQSRPCHLHGRRILRKKPEIQHAQQRHGLRPEKEIAAFSPRRQIHEEKVHAILTHACPQHRQANSKQNNIKP